MWNIFLLERNISSTYVLFAENIKIKSPGWISSLITFIIYHLITYYGCMQANNFQGGKQIFFKRSIHNIRWSWPRLVLSHVMYIFTVIINLTTGTRIPDPPPFFPHLVPPAIMVWIFVWKYIFEPFIHILQHFVIELSRYKKCTENILQQNMW